MLLRDLMFKLGTPVLPIHFKNLIIISIVITPTICDKSHMARVMFIRAQRFKTFRNEKQDPSV